MEDFPDAQPFDHLPTRSYGPHKIIRCKQNELLVVTRGLVEIWQTHHDLLVKQLVSGTLFGDVPLLGQTMVMTQAQAGGAGATLAMMNVEQVQGMIQAHALAIAERLYPRLAAVDTEHYRASFQYVSSRLAALLLELAGEGSTVTRLTQREMGEKVGLVRETVAVTLAAMKANRLIAIDRRKTTILDRTALEELSQR